MDLNVFLNISKFNYFQTNTKNKNNIKHYVKINVSFVFQGNVSSVN